MRISLEIADDKELREAVKRLVVGQAKAVIRGEIDKMLLGTIEKVIEERLKNIATWNLERWINDATTNLVKKTILSDRYITEINKHVADAAKSQATTILEKINEETLAKQVIAELVSKVSIGKK